jgi:hypothetical protein
MTVLVACALTYAQVQPTESDADKEKKQKAKNEHVVKMLEQSIVEAGSLRLPQNRAVIYALTGDMFWKFDDKRARELFRNAGAELVAYNLEVEKERSDSDVPMVMQYFDYSAGPRTEILPIIARRDAELALELLIQTRPARLAEEMLKTSAPNAKQAAPMNFDPERQRVRQEIALEQQFAMSAADENPEKAIKLIKDSLSKGISHSVLPLLQKLNKKDEKKAAELGGDVIKKLVDSDLAQNGEDLQIAIQFLQFAFKPQGAAPKDKPFAFSEKSIKDLAGKVADTLLQPSRSLSIAMFLSQAMSVLEKFVPERSAQLRQRQAEVQGELPTEFAQMQQQQRMWDPNSTPEDILAQLPQLKNDMERSMAYQNLTSKIGQIDDDARARKLIDQIPDEKTRMNALEQLESRRISRTAGAGKLEDARRMIRNLTKKKIQIQKLVALATEFYKKSGEENIAAANELMGEARSLTSEYAETGDDLADIMELVKGYATIDPDIAFKLYEPVIDVLNEHIQASAAIAKFNAQTTLFTKGELKMKVGGGDFPLFRYIPQMQMLGKADLDRMNNLADRFHRNDVRAIVKLHVLQGFLRDEKIPAFLSAPGGVVIMNDE